jgi:hypothetical protein
MEFQQDSVEPIKFSSLDRDAPSFKETDPLTIDRESGDVREVAVKASKASAAFNMANVTIGMSVDTCKHDAVYGYVILCHYLHVYIYT